MTTEIAIPESRFVALACLAILVSSVPAQESNDDADTIKPVAAATHPWQAGERFTCLIKEDATSRTDAGERFFKLHSILTLDTSWEITKVLPNGGVAFTVGIDRLQFEANGDGAAAMVKDLVFDSKADPKPGDKTQQAVASILKRHIGPVARGKLDAQGKVTFFSFDATVVATFKEQKARELGGFFSGPFSSAGLRHSLVHWLVTQPAGELTKGAAWTQETISRGGPKITCRRSYEVVGEEDRDGVPRLMIRIAPEYVGTAPIGVGEQTGSGTVYVDKASGSIREVSLRHEAVVGTDFSSTSIQYDYSATVTAEAP